MQNTNRLSWLFKKDRAGYIGLALIVAAGLMWYAALGAERASSETALYFLNVGQGDSSLIELSDGTQILIDGGPSGRALLENLAEVLPPQDKYIDLLVMTHPQLDHFGGFVDVLKNYEIGGFVGTGRKAEIAAYPELHEQLEKHKIPYFEVSEGDQISIGEATLDILSPSPNEITSGELNDTSVVVLLTTPDFRALYTGDIDSVVEARLIKDYDLDVDVLKVPHHGSRFSSTKEFLQELSPNIAIIEVGKNNYGHPTAQALDRLKEFSQQVFRTDKNGIIKITLENGELVASSGY